MTPIDRARMCALRCFVFRARASDRPSAYNSERWGIVKLTAVPYGFRRLA